LQALTNLNRKAECLNQTQPKTELARIDVSISSRLSAAGYTAPADAATVAQEVLTAASIAPIQANIQRVNGQDVGGAGTEADPWGPA